MSAREVAKPEKFKEQIRQDWVEAAAAWRKWNPKMVIQSFAATEAIVALAQVKPGMNVLDLASGSGQPVLTLAKKVGPEGRVTATDLVPPMLAIAEENARKEGIGNMTFQQADAEELPFPDESFDLVTCSFGVMFFSSCRRALGEIKRVLKPGCRVAFVAWGPMEKNPAYAMSFGIFMKYSPLPPPDPGAPGPFKFAEPGKLSAALEEAGFRDVREESRSIPWTWPGSVEEALDSMLERSATLRKFVLSIPPLQVPRVRAEALNNMRRHDDGHQLNFPAEIVLASGIK